MAVPAIVGPLIGLGASLWSSTVGAMGSRKNRKSQERQNQLDRQQSQFMYEYERDDAIKQWERENAYNHPKQQMQRLKEAGLNPNTIFSSGVSMPSSHSSGGSFRDSRQPAPQTDYSWTREIPIGVNNAISSYYEAKRFEVQENQANQVIATQATLQALNDAKTLEALERMRATKFDTELKLEVRDSIKDSYRLKNELIGTQIDRNTAEITKLDVLTKKLAQDIILDQGRYELEKAKTGKELVRIAADIALKAAQKKALESNTELNRERKLLLEGQAKMLAELANKLNVEAQYIPFNSGVSAGKTLLDGLFGKEWLPSKDKKPTPKTQSKKPWAPPRR